MAEEKIEPSQDTTYIESSFKVAPDTQSVRVEPVLSDNDFWVGIELIVNIALLDEKGISIWNSQAVLQTGPLGDGNSPFLQITDPLLLKESMIVASSKTDSKYVQGLRITAADKPDNLPLAKPTPIK